MEKHILLIDDDDDELEIFTEALNQIAVFFTCCQARNVEQAVESIRKRRPDFIFIDYNMPKINGLECLEQLRLLVEPGTTRFIIYSNYIDEKMNARALALGAELCMKKPYLTSSLAKRLKEILLRS